MNTQPVNQKRKQGMAVLSTQERSRIASLGGKAAHAKGTAHQFDSAEAREAGRKGGLARAQKMAQLRAQQQAIQQANAEVKT